MVRIFFFIFIHFFIVIHWLGGDPSKPHERHHMLQGRKIAVLLRLAQRYLIWLGCTSWRIMERAVLEQVICMVLDLEQCSLVVWAVLGQVFTGHLGSVGTGVHRLSGQCWGRYSPVIWAELGQVFTCRLGSVGAGIYWLSGQCWGRYLPVIWAALDWVQCSLFIWAVLE